MEISSQQLWRFLVLISLALSSPGCAYLLERGKDAGDIVGAGVSGGGGLGLRLGATQLVDLEVYAQTDETFYGWRDRNSRWTESGYGLGLANFWMPGLGDEERPSRHWYDAFTTSRRRIHFPNRDLIEDRRHTLFLYSGGSGGSLVDALDVEVSASILGFGIQLALRPGEFADFLLGWFGLDLAGDDQRDSSPRTTLPGTRKPTE